MVPATDDSAQLIEEEGGVSITYRLRRHCTGNKCRGNVSIILIVLLLLIGVVVFCVVFGIKNKSSKSKSNSVKGTHSSFKNVSFCIELVNSLLKVSPSGPRIQSSHGYMQIIRKFYQYRAIADLAYTVQFEVNNLTKTNLYLKLSDRVCSCQFS